MNKRLLLLFFLATIAVGTQARHTILSNRYQSLTVMVNNNWLSAPVMQLNSGDILNISFDELSHDAHRLIYKIEHCEIDGSVSEDIFESDYLEGFNGMTIDNYEKSRGTTVLYTHYRLQIPNEQCRLKMSGNYRLTVYEEDNEMEEVLQVDFAVNEDLMKIGMEVSTNTDIDINNRHQQLHIKLNYGNVKVNNIDEQLHVVVRQNEREDNQCINPRPTFINLNGLEWSHQRELIFPAGNEYRKFEVLALSHPTMGIDHISWDGEMYNAYPFVCEERKNYLYDVDANGCFYIRNSDNFENDVTCDYVFVHYQLLMDPPLEQGNVMIDGRWCNNRDKGSYMMSYDEETRSYHATLLQKQGYYSYQLLGCNDEERFALESEGNFYQTENTYQMYVYYKKNGGRTWRLVGYKEVESSQR